MKKNTPILWIFLGSLLILPAHLAAQERGGHGFITEMTWNKELKSALLVFEEGVERRSIQKIDSAISQIEKIRIRLQTETLPFISEFLLKKGEVLSDRGESDIGARLIERVREAFPGDYRPDITLSRIYLSTGSPVSGLISLVRGSRLYLGSKIRKAEQAGLASLILLINLTLTGYTLLLLFFLKHFRKIFFDLARIFHSPMSSSVFIPLAFSFFLIPFFLGGLFTLFITLPFLSWPYLKTLKDKLLVFAFTALIFGSVPFLHFLGDTYFDNTAYTRLKLDEFSRKTWDMETLRVLDEQLEENRESLWLNTAKGLIYKWKGEHNRSYAIFRRLYDEHPDNPDVLINIGNYKLTTGRLNEARNFYKRALLKNPDIAEARYNLSVTLDALLEFDSAKGEFEKAYNLDSKKIQRFLESKREKTEYSEPMDKMPSGQVQALAPVPERERAIQTVMKIVSFPFKREGVSLVLFVWFIYLAIFLGLRRKFIVKPIEECSECGTIFYGGSTCRICTALMLPHSRVEPVARKRVVEKLGNYHFRKKLYPFICNIFVPGSGFFLKKREIPGVCVMFGHWMLITLSLLCFLFVSPPLYLWTALCLFIACYLLTNIFLILDR